MSESKCTVCDTIAKHELESHDGDTHLPDAHVGKRIKNEREILETLKNAQDRAADKITEFAGSLRFVYIHTVWFVFWILINAGIFSASVVFDKFPYGLLTMIVSLEAIFLSTFVMVSQNRQAARADLRAELDYETNIRSEIWSLHIGQQLGLDTGHVEREVARVIAVARNDGAS